MAAADATGVTDVADAFDTEGAHPAPFEIFLGTDVEAQWAQGTLTREPIDRPGFDNPGCSEATPRGCLPLDELAWTRQTLTQTVSAQIGLYHDLALTLELPIIHRDILKFDYAPGVDAATSTVDTGDPATSLFAHDFAAYHGGLGAMGLGVRWGPFNDQRDTSKPNLVVYFKWLNPATAHTNRLRGTTSASSPGAVGDGMHRLIGGMAFSKRLAHFGLGDAETRGVRRGWAEPYMELSYAFPIAAPGRTVDALSPAKAGAFAARPSQIARFSVGTELIPYEDLQEGRRISIDLGLRGAYVSDGRNYTILSDALQRLTYSEQYLSVTAVLALVAQPWPFMKMRLSVATGFDTDHLLTNEVVGADTNHDGQILTPSLDTQSVKDQTNPYYCGNDPADICSQKHLSSFDSIGLRFRESARATTTAYLGIVFLIPPR